jgi:hypothetical protein
MAQEVNIKYQSQTHLRYNIRVTVTLRLVDSQAVCLGVEAHLRLMTRYTMFRCVDLGFYHFGAPLTQREGGSGHCCQPQCLGLC